MSVCFIFLHIDNLDANSEDTDTSSGSDKVTLPSIHVSYSGGNAVGMPPASGSDLCDFKKTLRGNPQFGIKVSEKDNIAEAPRMRTRLPPIGQSFDKDEDRNGVYICHVLLCLDQWFSSYISRFLLLTGYPHAGATHDNTPKDHAQQKRGTTTAVWRH